MSSRDARAQLLSIPEQVHIVPLGYEYDRVLTPLLELKANKVIFLDYQNKERPGYHDVIRDRLDEEQISRKTVECNIFDLYDALGAFAKCIQDHEDADVYVNVATGSKITAIAGMLACMIEGATPYYAQAEYYGEEVMPAIQEDESIPDILEIFEEGGGPRPVSHGVSKDDIIELPAYPIEHLDGQHIAVLNFLSETGEASKRELIEFCEEERLPFIQDREETNRQGKYKLLDNHILSELEDDGYVETEERGRKKMVALTPTGQNTLNAFGYMI